MHKSFIKHKRQRFKVNSRLKPKFHATNASASQ